MANRSIGARPGAWTLRKKGFLGGSYGADVVPVDCARNCSGQEPGISAVASRLGRPPVGPHAGRCPQL